MPCAIVLFLCTGNYYRSRFAEILFNVLAKAACLPYRADSRGLALERLGVDNVGPLSPYAIQGLVMRGIQLDHEPRFPLALQEKDLQSAAHVIALDESEHRPLLQHRFPQWVERVAYWRVADTDRASPAIALAQIERQVKALIQELKDVPRSSQTAQHGFRD